MAEERVPRRLAAILAADVVGYSRLMEKDEEGTLTRLRALRHDLFEPIVRQHNGRIFKTTGDGALVEFKSASDAVRSAVAIQRALGERNSGTEDDARVMLRIGVSLGDVLIQGSDLYGNGVNVAARMEALAEPGGICISGNVHEHVRGASDLAFDDLGEQQVKNIDRPVPCYRVRGQDTGSAAAPDHAARTERPGIAVLPFANMSGDPEQEYFADGMVEEIITGLSRIRWLTVIARNSTFAYKGSAPDIRKVGRDLAVRYVLEGSVRKAGDKVRITAQLVEADTGGHLWAERFDGTLADVFDLQDRITAAVVGAIQPSVRRAEIERTKRKRPENLDAYDQYLRALAHYHAAGEGYAAALPTIERALALDPDFVEAHGLAAALHWRRHSDQTVEREDRDAALSHARAVWALGTDDAESLAHAAQAFLFAGADIDTASAMVERALESNPNSAMAHTVASMVCLLQGRTEAHRTQAERALELSPLDPRRFTPLVSLALGRLADGDFENALGYARRASQVNPNYAPSRLCSIAANVALGRIEDARSDAAALLAGNPEFRISKSTAVRTFREMRIFREIRDLGSYLREAGLPD